MYQVNDETQNLELVMWLSAQFQGSEVRLEASDGAASQGSIQVLQYLYDNDNNLDRERDERSDWSGPSSRSVVALGDDRIDVSGGCIDVFYFQVTIWRGFYYQQPFKVHADTLSRCDRRQPQR